MRTARKHVGWYLAGRAQWRAAAGAFNAIDTPRGQLAAIDDFFGALRGRGSGTGQPDGAANDTDYAGRQAA